MELWRIPQDIHFPVFLLNIFHKSSFINLHFKKLWKMKNDFADSFCIF